VPTARKRSRVTRIVGEAMPKWWSSMLPLNWLRKGHPNQIQAHVRGDGGDLLQWIRERLSHALHGVRSRFSHVCLLASDAQARNTAFTSRLRSTTWLAQTGEKDNHLFPAGKIAMTLFSFFALKSPRELSLPSHMS
jgi:hypothetical protein